MKRLVTILSTLVLSTMLAGPAISAPPANAGPPSGILGLNSPRRVPDQFIVVLNPRSNARAMATRMARRHGGTVLHVYEHALKGFAIRLPEPAAEAIARNPNVAYVEADQTVSLNATQSPATWGLDRVDQRSLPLDNAYTYDFDGTGVDAYIIDTGIRVTHNQFGGRALLDFTAVNDGNGASDCNGHGTHVAGTVGGSTYGIAKNVALHAVRVLDCQGSGTTSGVIDGIDWVTNNHASPAVANMSLGGGVSTSLDNALNNSVASGVFYAVAAGNSNADACNSSPSRAAEAYTIAATDDTDTRASFSNFGSCVDIFAPGVNITSSWNTSDTATNTISGTSMATPHVTGAAALVLDEDPSLTPDQVKQTLTNRATANVVTDPAGSPNLLLYTLAASGGGGGGGGGSQSTVFSEDFDAAAGGGEAPGWNKSSATNDLWRLASDCVSAPSGSFQLAFSRTSPNCDYDVGTASGWARSPNIDLSGATAATLKFDHFWETESYSGAFDVMEVQVSANGGSTWSTIETIDSSDSNPAGYVSESLDVSSFISSSFRIRFMFDSQDGVNNDFLGWYVDNVEVTAN